MAENPRISIIVRTYNRPQRLHECLQSLARQDFDTFEVVIVNDAGKDVAEIIPVELGSIPCQYIRNPQNRGRTAALNIGVEAARGRYIGFLDDDDVVYPHHLRTLADAAFPENRPVVYSDIINVVYQQDPQTHDWKRVQEQLVYSFDFERDNFLLANYIPITCLLIRRDCFETTGPFDESLLIYEDWEYLIRLSRRYPFHHIRSITGEYRRRDDNSNIVEKTSYPINERVVKRRYRDDRDAVFDPIFKRTFEIQRAARASEAKAEQYVKQIQHYQAQLREAQRIITHMQQQIRHLQAEKSP